MLKLYHGSNVRIERIDLSVGHINKDFGKGFYLTDIKTQADEMAKRKARLFLGTEPIVTTFMFDDRCMAYRLRNQLRWHAKTIIFAKI